MMLNHTLEGSGPLVLLLHPVGLNLTFLAPLALVLRQRYRVMRIDLRGHGHSPLTPRGGRPADGLGEFADDVHDTLAQTGFAPCAVVGFSFGGMVAQTLALRHPADVSALVPCACPCTLTTDLRAISAARGADALAGGMQAILEKTLERWFTPAFRKAGGDAATRAHLLALPPEGWAQGWHAIANIDTLPRLPEIHVPTLCLAGEVDASSPPSAMALIAEAIPGASMKVLSGAPHMLFMEQPDAVAAEIVAFLGSLPASPQAWA
jgi:3-oxoadipate enol-lactonase